MERVTSMYLRPLIAISFAGAGLLVGQAGSSVAAAEGTTKSEPAKPVEFSVGTGTKVPLSLLNSISTKHSAVGDTVYLETIFPILSSGRIVIPVGSYVAGKVTEIKRPGRVKGRGELYVRFETLTLPNGVTRDFRGRIGTIDGQTDGELDRTEGAVKSEGNKAGDVRTVAETTGMGASIGGMAGAAAGHLGAGLGIGSAAGAAAGIIAVLATRGPDAVLARGSTVEMVLDRPLLFSEPDLDFGNYRPSVKISDIPAAGTAQKNESFPRRPFPN